jgi:hydroxypyruvate isomerase
LLEEDLYLRLKSGKPIEIPESWVVADCITSITDCISNNFNLKQKVSEETPGKAFAMLVSTHFSQQRGTGISIYNYFKTSLKKKDQHYLGLVENIKTFGQVREMVLQENLQIIKELQEKKKIELAIETMKRFARKKMIEQGLSLSDKKRFSKKD